MAIINETIILDDAHKVEIVNNTISFFEKMGTRWVQLDTPEFWSDEMIAEEFHSETAHSK